EDEIRKRQKAEDDRRDSLKEQMKRAERLSKKQEPKEGEVDKFTKALSEADFKKAQDEAERLSRKLAQQAERDGLRKKLKDKDKEMTAAQRKAAEDELERLNREQKDQEKEQDRLRKKIKEDDSKEKLDREQRKAAEDELERLTREQKQKEEEQDR